MLRARPVAPFAAGLVAGIALALLPGAWISPALAGAPAAVLSIRWRHPAWADVATPATAWRKRVAPEIILVGAPEGYSSPKVLEALPFAPRLTGRERALEIELK
jgi:hypothetical protein